jgi:hypothetical protein
MTYKNKAVIEFFNRNYTIDKEGVIKNPKGEILQGHIDSTNKPIYKKFKIRLEDRNISCNVHRIQGYAKFGEQIFDKTLVVRHLDGNSLNNSWENIGIGTFSDNQLDIPKEQRILNASHPKHNHQEIFEDYK